MVWRVTSLLLLLVINVMIHHVDVCVCVCVWGVLENAEEREKEMNAAKVSCAVNWRLEWIYVFVDYFFLHAVGDSFVSPKGRGSVG